MNVHLPMRIGGWLAAQDIRLAYTASCLLGCVVCVIHTFFFHETLPRNRRVPFTWAGHSPLAFLRLFRRSHEREGGGQGGGYKLRIECDTSACVSGELVQEPVECQA